MNIFNLDQVTNVYSGRKGCACGCRGKYSYAAKFACERPSYFSEGEGINDRTVKSIVNKVEKMLADPTSEIERVHFDADWVAVDLEHDRTYTIYFS